MTTLTSQQIKDDLSLIADITEYLSGPNPGYEFTEGTVYWLCAEMHKKTMNILDTMGATK